jgi:micrococcal nuclease
VRVVDGDTLIVGDKMDKQKQYRIRLIGADTPEVVKSGTMPEPFGQEASDFTKRMIAESNNQVRIAFDGEQLDRYNRTLAMVYLQTPDGEVWLNELLIREGLAHARLEYRYSQTAKLAFAVAEVEARRNKRNLWSVDIEGIEGKQ